MRIKIDHKEINIELKDQTKNIVDIAKINGITIVAPCYNTRCKYGCCKACLILVNGQKKYACGTKPIDGMEVVYQNDNLRAERKSNLKSYANKILNETQEKCCPPTNNQKQEECFSSTNCETNNESCC
ncbi:MAG: 2Fe-2S iron-sulfur cluster-binding protein [Candidatus Izemoplasma sp.]